MQYVTRAGAWSDGEVAYLAWDMKAKIQDCLGFMITRVHETGADKGALMHPAHLGGIQRSKQPPPGGAAQRRCLEHPAGLTADNPITPARNKAR